MSDRMEDLAKITLADILKDTNYQLTQFSDKNIIELENGKEQLKH